MEQKLVVDANSSKFYAYQLVLMRAPGKAYYPGENVAGQVVIHPRNRLESRSVQLVFSGKIHTRVKHSAKAGHHATSDLDLFDKKVILHTGALEAKMYVLPFSFPLPEQLPSTVEGEKHSYIQYHMSSCIDCPFYEAFYNPAVSTDIQVWERIDLNEPLYANPTPRYQSNDVVNCCCCCQYDPLLLEAHFDHGGYMAGEIVTADITVENPTDKPLKGGLILVVEERRVLKANSTSLSHTGESKKVVLTHKVASTVPITRQRGPNEGTGLLGQGKPVDSVHRTQFELPILLPPTTNHPHIAISYAAKISVPGTSLEVIIPFVIGTVPRPGLVGMTAALPAHLSPPMRLSPYPNTDIKSQLEGGLEPALVEDLPQREGEDPEPPVNVHIRAPLSEPLNENEQVHVPVNPVHLKEPVEEEK